MSHGGRRRLPLVVLALGLAATAFFALTYRPAPVVPRDRDHDGVAAPAGCMRCHGPEGSSPRPPDHPINEACFSCHRWAS